MKSSILQQYLLGGIIVCAFLLPHTNTVSLLVNPLLCILLVLLSRGRVPASIVWIPIIPIIISVIINIQYVHSKALFSAMTFLLYFSLFPMIGKVCVKNSFLYIVLAVIVFSQIAYFFNISPLVHFFNTYYPLSEDDLIKLEYMRVNIFDNRMGGLYHNSNQCARYITMLLGFFLVVNKESKITRLLPFILIAYFSILLTGSRTGFITGSGILFFAFVSHYQLSSTKKLIYGLLAIIGFGLFLYLSSGTLRGLKIEEGLTDSVGYKWGAFLYYLRNETSFVHLLFGYLDVSLFDRVYGVTDLGFDSEYGSLIYRFGFLGFISIMFFWYLLFKRTGQYYRIFYVNLLWMISSTIVCSYRAFFIFMLFLSVIYANSRKKVLRPSFVESRRLFGRH